jgi:hypothetical protein
MTTQGLASLRNFVKKVPDAERCDLCSVALCQEHWHLIEPQTRRLFCTCDPCAVLFSSGGDTRYRRVPRDIRYVKDFRLPDQAWNSLAIPIGLAFMFYSSVSGEILAVYPSPAGPTETTLDTESWVDLVAENPVLETLIPDVEALLVNRLRSAREYFFVPIDQCYKLTGLVRKYWRGFSGGDEAWAQIEYFFERLRERSYAGSLV